MIHTTFDSDGKVISTEELPDVEDPVADSIAAVRTFAGNMAANSNTRKALEAVADALEALPS